MSESRLKKFQKLFSQQISSEEKLINYFSCAFVADILLQGHLYVSENYFSFYSNVFGYVTKLVIPVSTVKFITKEKTAKMFPNAIGILLNSESKHVFGSFLSREAAYQLMCSIHKKADSSIEPQEIVEAFEDEVDGTQIQDIEEMSLEDSSSISGSENGLSPAQFKIPIVRIGDAIEEEDNAQPSPVPVESLRVLNESDLPLIPTPVAATATTSSAQTDVQIGKVGNFNFKLMNEFNLLSVGIILTVLLAFFSGLLLLKINAIESHHQQPSAIFHDFANNKISIDEAESILNKNLLIVRNVRKKLEDLQSMLQSSFDKMPLNVNEKQEF